MWAKLKPETIALRVSTGPRTRKDLSFMRCGHEFTREPRVVLVAELGAVVAATLCEEGELITVQLVHDELEASRGPTLEQWLAAGYTPCKYPPDGFDEVESPGLTAYRAKQDEEPEREPTELGPSLIAEARKHAAAEAEAALVAMAKPPVVDPIDKWFAYRSAPTPAPSPASVPPIPPKPAAPPPRTRAKKHPKKPKRGR